ncbi:hypothetical protein DL95DRAFT_302173 [Leptodontidium sp. 2 PMI_412]|nr:hypothetical protein DL95DRAFT_302173 [Leptodontidium sp. 2 PMI_412]
METTDVIICGCGPTGAMLSAYLGQQSVGNIVLEKELEITQDPRGIALDEDGIRMLQGAGVYDKIFTEIGEKMGYFNFVSGANNLHATPFLRFNYNTVEGGTGHPGFMCHKQPVLERCLRDAIEQHSKSEIRPGSTVQSISDDGAYVYVTYTNVEAEQKTLRARFFVGADGKTGFTRKRYLEPKGITMETDKKFKYEATWVALNWRIALPTPESHPDFPLWRLGYTPDQVYDAFFPKDFTFICNPDRPSVCGRFGLRNDYLWRFEFVVKPGEDGYEMAKYENVKEVVYPYLTLRKEQFSLSKDLAFPEDCIEVIRSRPFTFSARSCNKWSLGRVLLCGDAAHVFPPFGGQGIASGFRDAASLAWRLAVACRPNFHDHEKLFEAWYTERKQQLEQSLAATIVNGNLCNERSLVKIFLRDWSLWSQQLIPSWRHWFELGQRQEGLTKYVWSPGMPFLPELGGGKIFPQVFCLPCGSAATKAVFTDDVIFGKGKTALFPLVVLLRAESEIENARRDLADLEKEHQGELRVEEASYFIDEPSFTVCTQTSQGIAYRILHTELSNPSIWGGLPEPIGYDGSRLRREVEGRYVILRPDRFIFATCNTSVELVHASRSLSEALSGL